MSGGPGDGAVSDPVGMVADVVAAAEPELTLEQIRAVVTAVAGGRAKSRRLAAAIAERPQVLADGRSPAPRVAGELLIALRAAGAAGVSLPCCAGCGKQMRTLQRRGQDWFCPVCGKSGAEPCAACGKTRPVHGRDRAGQPRCAKCPVADDRDPVAVIHAMISALDPAASEETVAAAVRRAAPRPHYQRQLAWALEDHPELLTGDGHLAPLRAIPRMIDLLHAAGVAGIIRPACGRCRRVVRIDKPLDGVRVCRTCIAHSRIEPCGRCGTRCEPITRDEHGRPLCSNCFMADRANLETCTGCGRLRRVERRTADGPLCQRCPSLPVRECFICGQSAPCGTSRFTGQPWCPPCQRRQAACSACGRHAPVASGTPADPRCAGCTPPPPWAGCPACSDPDCPSPGRCERCHLGRLLDELMGTDAAVLPAGLQALRGELAAAENPGTAMRWLTKPSLAPALSGLASGRIPLTHQGLDELPRTQVLDHLRQTLVAVGALPERDEELIRLEAFLHEVLASERDTERRRLLHRYLNWHLVRRLRSRNNGRPATRQQSLMIRRLARGTIAFLNWLDAHGLTLGTCRQADLDDWLTDSQAAYREEAGRFIRWAHAAKLTPVSLPSAARWNGPAELLDDQDRWGIARRLLHDDSLKPEDRLAGLLVLLYAQHTTAISRMTTGQVQADGDTVRLSLGRVPVQLPEPVATLARTVAANRKGHATIGAAKPSPWLFPGGQPGRPVSGDRLTQRLEALGIRSRRTRSAALFQLATEIPAAILARTLGISTDAAAAWQRLSAGDWAAYAADVSRRPPRPQPVSSRHETPPPA
jgi:hypothetical protein